MSSSTTEHRRLHALRGYQSGVHIWSEPVVIPTYPVLPADRNPMYLDRRVYQGSSGKVYPLPYVDRVATEREDRVYEAIHIENEYLYVMVLPEIGGRIHIGFDKTSGYDFFYRQNSIKPALVGLAGPWISGGVEFNWPQHHRPSTFMPCEWYLEEGEDGSQTVWLSEHEPFNRMKGMHGICLRPGNSAIELKVRLYNRTALTQTFLWWANVAARCHEHYQSFFPPDVRIIADHAKRATETFPAITDTYYGIAYGERVRSGVPADERPSKFLPDGSYPANCIDWYANIPVPTSYMALNTVHGFFGGYDHAADAGFIHFADPNISPGKKQWTWGNHDFGYCWDRNLSDDAEPYVELMAGVYTDNQPDFTFLAPYETKAFSQVWYPIRKIGPAKSANVDAALAVEETESGLRIGVATTRRRTVRIRVVDGDSVAWSADEDVAPESPVIVVAPVRKWTGVGVVDADGVEIVGYTPEPDGEIPMVEPATAPPAPADIKTIEELYLVGLHLEQYRHPTRAHEPYWEEALRREPNDSRCNVAMGRWRFRRGEFDVAEEHFRRAIGRLTMKNPNPADGEAFYQLGMVLEHQGRFVEAERAFGKATWSYEWKSAANYRLACLTARRGDAASATAYLHQSILGNGDHNEAHALLAAFARSSGKASAEEAISVLSWDPLDHWALREASLAAPADYRTRYLAAMRDDPQNFLDLAICYSDAGMFGEARAVLAEAPPHAMVLYAAAAFGDEEAFDRAEAASLDYVFPHRLAEMQFLRQAISARPKSSHARYLLGNLLYHFGRHEEAMRLWEEASQLDGSISIVWRNLGVAYYNVKRDLVAARDAFAKARACAPDDARLLYEDDQLSKRRRVAPADRLAVLRSRPDLVGMRDDLLLELVAVLVQTGEAEEAASRLASKTFAPWEGGEGSALRQHIRTHLALGKRALRAGDAKTGLTEISLALATPANLGEARHILANASNLWFWMGEALDANGRHDEARRFWQRAADFQGDFHDMNLLSYSDMTLYQALSMRRLGRDSDAESLLEALAKHAVEMEGTPATIDFFLTTLVAHLVFLDDLDEIQTTAARFLGAQALFGLGETARAKEALMGVLQRDPNHAGAADLLAGVDVP